MSKSDLNGERSQCRYTGLSYCSVTHREAGIPACRSEMVKIGVKNIYPLSEQASKKDVCLHQSSFRYPIPSIVKNSLLI